MWVAPLALCLPLIATAPAVAGTETIPAQRDATLIEDPNGALSELRSVAV